MPSYDPGPHLPVPIPHPPDADDNNDGPRTSRATSSVGLVTDHSNTCCSHSCLRSFSLPPSPPLTNPHLKRAIPLPCYSEACHLHDQLYIGPVVDRSSMEEEHVFTISPSASPSHVKARSVLLSPPYSPVRHRLQLLSLDECTEDVATDTLSPEPRPETASDSSDFLEELEWKGDIDDVKRTESYQESLFEDSENWEEFLGRPAPSALDGSEGLDLTLYGPGAPDSSQDSHYVPSSPSFRSASLPDLGSVPEDGAGNMLLDPSDFDVFNNGWDKVVSGSTQTLQTIEEDLDPRSLDGFAFGQPPAHATSPESPSRRNVIDLPGGELYDREPGRDLPSRPSSPINLPSELIDTVTSSPWHRTFDVPFEAFQSPYFLPQLLSPPSPTQQSLLFAPPEPEDVPLPDSPENERHLIGLLGSDSDDDEIKDVPLHLLEEPRLRELHKISLSAELQARTTETMLTEYIRRLNEMKPPREEVMSPAQSNSFIEDSSLANIGPGPATLQFLQTRRKDVQHLVALRAVERRKRKKAKERGRELEALLQLKSAQLRAEALLNRQRLRLTSHGHATETDADGIVVLAASGSDCHHMCKRDSPLSEEMRDSSNKPNHQDEIMQLVAKMIFRRRDSPRPLTGKIMTLSRPYRRSSLSQEENIENIMQGDDS